LKTGDNILSFCAARHGWSREEQGENMPVHFPSCLLRSIPATSPTVVASVARDQYFGSKGMKTAGAGHLANQFRPLTSDL
jgi:hypothetical protein